MKIDLPNIERFILDTEGKEMLQHFLNVSSGLDRSENITFRDKANKLYQYLNGKDSYLQNLVNLWYESIKEKLSNVVGNHKISWVGI